MREPRYAEDKPKDCSLCFYWDEGRSKCRLGKMNCYYLLEDPHLIETPCRGCPYKKGGTLCLRCRVKHSTYFPHYMY